MPFLRAVSAGSSPHPPLEIRSAKTLIGCGQGKCDVVLPKDRGVLDLHALLSLSDDQATATLVPFSSTSDGACFLNGRLVPPDGVAVVHGDRVAFGNADNAFVFSLTDSRSDHVNQKPLDATASLQNSRSFRRTVDILRGDRGAAALTTGPWMGSKRPGDSVNKSLSGRGSRDRLEKFLLNASTDSLLGDFVERKLRDSNSAAAARRERPTATEPPPSLSASVVSSLRSSLNDSIMDRPTSNLSEHDRLLSKSQSLLSTAERNYAEIEKLRLSQRLREVNNVLNGHLNFSSSYLSTERRSSGSATMRLSSPQKPLRRSFNSIPNDDPQEEEEEEEDESVEELPTLVERPMRKRVAVSSPKSAKPTPQQSLTASIASMLERNLHGKQTLSPEDETEVDIPLDESLPSFSEAILKPPRRPDENARESTAPVVATKQPDAEAAASEEATSTRKVRPQLHQQLIDRTLRRKRHEALTEAFHSWRRGLRVQQHQRREKTKQRQLLDRKLQILRRNHTFLRWKQWTERKRQILDCREEAFVHRQTIRLMQTTWRKWMVWRSHAKHTRRILRRFVISVATTRLRSRFQRWRAGVEYERTLCRENDLMTNYQGAMKKRMEIVARSHHVTRITRQRLHTIIRAWQKSASDGAKRRCVLRRILQTGFRRFQHRAWNTWKHHTTLLRQAEKNEAKMRTEMMNTASAASHQLKAREQELRDDHEKQITELRTKLDEQQERLRKYESEKQERKKRLADAKSSAKARWNSLSEEMLKQKIAEADTQIASVSSRLEALLQHIDVEPEAARFQAASFLVESMLEQKMRSVNERVLAQEEMLRSLSDELPEVASRDATSLTWKKALANNARFLLEMAHQRYARLHQLHQAIAKLAATVVESQGDSHSGVRLDPAKFKHAAFLTDAMHDRTLQQLDAVLAIYYRRVSAFDSAPREARKY